MPSRIVHILLLLFTDEISFLQKNYNTKISEKFFHVIFRPFRVIFRLKKSKSGNNFTICPFFYTNFTRQKGNLLKWQDFLLHFARD